MADYRIGLIIEQKGGELVARQAEVLAGKVKGIGDSAKGASGHSDALHSTLKALGGIVVIKKLANEFWDLVKESGAAQKQFDNFNKTLDESRKAIGYYLVNKLNLKEVFDFWSEALRNLNGQLTANRAEVYNEKEAKGQLTETQRLLNGALREEERIHQRLQSEGPKSYLQIGPGQRTVIDNERQYGEALAETTRLKERLAELEGKVKKGQYDTPIATPEEVKRAQDLMTSWQLKAMDERNRLVKERETALTNARKLVWGPGELASTETAIDSYYNQQTALLAKRDKDQAEKLWKSRQADRERAEKEAKAFFDSLAVSTAGGKYEQEMEQERQHYQAQIDAFREYAAIRKLDTEEFNARMEKLERLHRGNVGLIQKTEAERKKEEEDKELKEWQEQHTGAWAVITSGTQGSVNALAAILTGGEKKVGKAFARMIGAELVAKGSGLMIEGGLDVAKGIAWMVMGRPQGAALIGAGLLEIAKGGLAVAAGKALGGSGGDGGGGGGGGGGASSFGSGGGADLVMEKEKPQLQSRIIIEGAKRDPNQIVQLTQQQFYEIADFLNERGNEGSVVLDFNR